MRIHPGKAGLAALGLAELGAVLGGALAWCYIVGRSVLLGGVPASADWNAAWQNVLSMGVWALVIGAPLGAAALPALGLTVLRRAPLGRAVGLTVAGAACGLALGAALTPAGDRSAVPPLVQLFLGAGTLLGVAAARLGRREAPPAPPAAESSPAGTAG